MRSCAEYLVMKPLAPKQADVAAFISNCGARSFRLQGLEALSANLTVHSYGRCLRNMDTKEAKADVLQRYKFTLAFENSQVLKSLPAPWFPHNNILYVRYFHHRPERILGVAALVCPTMTKPTCIIFQ